MATVIKSSSEPLAAGPPAFALDDLSDETLDVIERARRQASRLVARAEAEAAQIIERAHREGEKAARDIEDSAIEALVAQRMAGVWPALQQAAQSVATARAEWLLQWEGSAVKLATAIAARVIRSEVTHNPEITLALVRESLELAAGSTHIRLRLHPEDLAQLGDFVERITEELAPAGTTELIADAAVEQGGCRLETSLGTIDQQFAAQLARIEEELGY